MDTVDCLVIAAVPEEFAAAREAGERLGATHWQVRGEGTAESYLAGRFESSAIALARAPGMGSREGGQFVATLIDRLRPAAVAMCGVCAGNPGETVLGDVIVADPAYQYDEGRQTPAAFQADHRQYPLSAVWKRTAQDFEPAGLPSHRTATEADADAWFLHRIRLGLDPLDHPANDRYPGTPQARLARLTSDGLVEDRADGHALTASGEADLKRRRTEATRPARLPYVVRTGPMASVGQVRKDADLWTAIKDRGVRKILAVEMEAATIATAAFQRELNWLVVKGVMDHADLEKNDSVKEFAARASAEVMFTLLSRLQPGKAAAREPVGVPGPVRLAVQRGLLGDWSDLADQLGLLPHETFRFSAGDQPRELWDWLHNRGRLGELPGALDAIGRADLAGLLRPYL